MKTACGCLQENLLLEAVLPKMKFWARACVGESFIPDQLKNRLNADFLVGYSNDPNLRPNIMPKQNIYRSNGSVGKATHIRTL